MDFDDAVKLAELTKRYRFEDMYDKENYVLELYKEWPEIDWNHLVYYPCSECGSNSQLLEYEGALCSACWVKQPPLEPNMLAKMNDIFKDTFVTDFTNYLNNSNGLMKDLKK